MYELPLFPLNTVLFPNMPIALHIFEPRYKLMIEKCLQEGQPFGIVLIRKGVEAQGPLAEPHPIGCAAQITQVERLPDGRLNIVAVGLERFLIHHLDYTSNLYLVGKVEPYPMDSSDPGSVTQAGQRLRPWVERYLSAISQFSEEVKIELSQLPDDPLALAYLAATLIQVPADQKQTLLAEEQALSLLTHIHTLYRREVALLDAMVARGGQHSTDEGMFSRN